MATIKFNGLMAEMTPEEIELIPRAVNVWLRAGWMDEAEADEWRRRYDAWLTFLDLDSSPPKPH